MSAFTLYLVLLCDSVVKLFTFLVVISVVSMIIGVLARGEASAHTDGADAIKVGHRMFLWSTLSAGLFATLLCITPSSRKAAFILGVTETVNSAVYREGVPTEVLKMWQEVLGVDAVRPIEAKFEKATSADAALMYKEGVYAVPTTREGAIDP